MRWGEGGARQGCSCKLTDRHSPVRDDIAVTFGDRSSRRAYGAGIIAVAIFESVLSCPVVESNAVT
jgi:hypothetical protein